MILEALNLLNFRNISTASLPLIPEVNLFIGQNGAGKSSLLEAIYLLSYGRSFRSHQTQRLIQHDNQRLLVHLKGTAQQSAQSLGYERHRDGKYQININGERQSSISALSALIPSQLLTTTSYRYFTDGPQLRRTTLNWGIFYQQPSFYRFWQRYQKALKQRNAALKAKLPTNQVSAWDGDLIECATKLHQLRSDYIEALQPKLQQLLDILLQGFSLKLRYEAGWDTAYDFETNLEQQYYASVGAGYTTCGPHRADCQLYLDDSPAHMVLSQGQQKLAIYALCFAQGLLLTESTGIKPIYLIDDLVSELDLDKIGCLAQVLQHLRAQTLITGIHQHLFDPITECLPSSIHSVNHGVVTSVSRETLST